MAPPKPEPRSPTPIVILVRPQLGDNIGAVARAMSNFGLRELRLVAPKNGWPNERAYDFATVSAAPILDAAVVYGTLPEALHDISLALASSARPRGFAKPVMTPPEAVRELAVFAGKSAILFGPERTGLENDELALADAIVTIPTSPENPSLNLAQSAVVMGYEYWRAVNRDALTPSIINDPPATKAELSGLFTQLETYLDSVDHFRTPAQKPVMWQNLRNIFVRAQMSGQEVRSMRGMIRALYQRRLTGAMAKEND